MSGEAGLRAKQAVKIAMAHLVFRRVAASPRRRVPILVYHRVVEEDAPLARYHCRSGLAVPAGAFHAQMAHLAAAYRVLPLKEVVACLRSGRSLPARTVALTFDDGYADGFQTAYPILHRHGLPATFFLPTAFVGTEQVPWTTRLDRLGTGERDRAIDRLREAWKAYPVSVAEERVAAMEHPHTLVPSPRVLRWDEVAAMRAGGMAVGGHTRRHALLACETPERARQEIHGCYDDLVTHLGAGRYGFAYPNGSQNATVRAWTRDAGFGFACGMRETSCAAGADLFDLPRRDINVWKSSWPDGRFCLPLFVATIEGWFLREATAVSHP